MIGFEIKKIVAIGSATILESGNTTQDCHIEIEMTGLVIGSKRIIEIITFEVPNSEVSMTQVPLYSAWMYIRDTLAPAWLSDNYKAL